MNDGDRLFIGLLCAGAVCVLVILIDGWFLRPQRDPGATSVEEPLLPKLAGYALVGLSLAMLWRLFRYEAVDFSLMLVVVGAVSGIIWAAGSGIFSRAAAGVAAASAGTPSERVREPIAVEYARSFFPVIILVLVIRSFLFEPFRIPSDSMMPTLYRRRLHLRQQVFLRLAAAGHQYPGVRHGHAATRRCDRVPPAAESEDQLHQAPGGAAGRPHPGR